MLLILKFNFYYFLYLVFYYYKKEDDRNIKKLLYIIMVSVFYLEQITERLKEFKC